jgi:hypothetical protein
VLSSKYSDGSFTETVIVTDGDHQTGVGFALGKIVRFGSLEFNVNHFGSLSLSPEGNDSCVVFVGIVHSGSPSVHTILEESADEDDTTSRGGEAPASPSLEGATW